MRLEWWREILEPADIDRGTGHREEAARHLPHDLIEGQHEHAAGQPPRDLAIGQGQDLAGKLAGDRRPLNLDEPFAELRRHQTQGHQEISGLA
jgi:hypothetical protein